MRVRKKDGRIEAFDLSKISLVLARVSDDYSQPLTKSDLVSLSTSIERTIKNEAEKFYGDECEPLINTSQIKNIVIEELEKTEFNQIAKAYKEYMKDFK